ncbi:hypothetical protein BBK36DRAFT_1130746 [Trichoderma citrinoviride]|uniref:C2H2-type domain-containing protein n=1 Tax=Trichoderma citrinoviride TaxID=58853 RepID=A0A2T4AXX2_9HYPO|nr:hypothetical protein BBK36DRAFT_1130746 [Trichoderma citrinoviride]PTB61828.1 hypothetical protein BBK36DRAFT_1130746 [Trichoderma citrinoviride]
MQLDSVPYDPDEAPSPGTPQMKAVRPRLQLTESPPPEIPRAQVSFSPPPVDGLPKSNRSKIVPVGGDEVLVTYLGGGRHQDVARIAGRVALPGGDDNFELSDDDVYPQKSPPRDATADPSAGADILQRPQAVAAAVTGDHNSLRAVAADALAAGGDVGLFHGEDKPSVDLSASTYQLSIHDDVVSSPNRHVKTPPLLGSRLGAADSASRSLLSPSFSELPPLLDSPKHDGANGPSLPSIQTTLGDTLNDRNHHHVATEIPTPSDNRDLPRRHTGDARTFSRSPTVGVPRFSSMSAGSHASHPISPSESYQRGFPSPNSLPASSPDNFAANGSIHRSSVDYANSKAPSKALQPGYTIPSPATGASVADRMSIDGITNPQVGSYSCTFEGCTAPPFQTQYLLNSHANVHSSARPHYCPVPGCPRAEGGKGFKRKNEMIRHGLVHDSPGYVCPFCADREHKYPRPDNLQRHVRVHHVDKSKDDPLLRDVLAQRPDGPSRGRRRRAQV